jgi:hypothetical protein
MRRSLVAVALTSSLLAPGAGHATLLDPLWSFFTLLWRGAIEKEGCGMDPDGRCAPAVQPKTDAGCGMDPDGRCIPKTQPLFDAGCGADPNG